MENTISGIKAGDFGVYFCDKTGNLVEEGQIAKRMLHVTQMTNPETYRNLVEKRNSLLKEFEIFIVQQDTAGLFKIPCLGGTLDTEYYPQVIL